jgi:hypothetical protein
MTQDHSHRGVEPVSRAKNALQLADPVPRGRRAPAPGSRFMARTQPDTVEV